jgi:glycosyltransferase involved in cell wall biosynthesis
VVSLTPHFRAHDGVVVGWEPTVRELDALAAIFAEVCHIAPLHAGPPPAIARPYSSPRVRVRPVRPGGGTGLRAKVGVLRLVPGWSRAITQELRRADAAHLRCPANISLVALLVLMAVRMPVARWFKYAGNWAPGSNEPFSYRLQRSLLRWNAARGVVTVNGRWPNQPSHVHPFVNPTLTNIELARGVRAAARKTLSDPVQLLFVGFLSDAKGAGRVIDVLETVLAMGLDARLDVVGDSSRRPGYEADVRRRGLADRVVFHGWLERAALDELYADAHVLVLPSISEGFPKVVAEAMAHGIVPIVGDVSCIADELELARTGLALPPMDVAAFAAGIVDLVRNGSWEQQSAAGVGAASRYAYEAYVAAVGDLLAVDDAQ